MLLPRRLAQEVSGGSMSRCGSRSTKLPGKDWSWTGPEGQVRAREASARSLSRMVRLERGGVRSRGGVVLRRRRVNPESLSPAPPHQQSCGGVPSPVGGLLGWESGSSPRSRLGPAGLVGGERRALRVSAPMTGEVSQLPTQLRWQHLPRLPGDTAETEFITQRRSQE